MTSVGLWLKWLFQRDTKGKLKISRRRKGHLVVSNQAVTYPSGGLAIIFCGFISHLIGRETINIPEIFFGVHGFTGKTVRTYFMNDVKKIAQAFREFEYHE